MSRWFRHYAGMMRDDKLVRAAIRSGQTIERVTWIWGAILESAAEIDDNGRYDLDAAEVAYFLRASDNDIESVLSALATVGRINKGIVVKWSDRQFQSDRSAERQKLYRERKKRGLVGVQSNDTRLSDDAEVTSLSRHGDAPETELETETDSSEPNGSSPRAWSLPVGVSLQVWQDFKRNRERKRLPNTETAWKTFNDDLKRISAQTGIPPPKLIEHAAAKGWASINDPTEAKHDRRTNALGRHQPPDGLSSTARAGLAVFGR